MNFYESAQHFAKVVRAQGWEPLVSIATAHGEKDGHPNITHHIYAMKGEKFAVFVCSNNQALVRDRMQVFATKDDGNADYREMVHMAQDWQRLYHCPAARIDFTKEDAA